MPTHSPPIPIRNAKPRAWSFDDILHHPLEPSFYVKKDDVDPCDERADDERNVNITAAYGCLAVATRDKVLATAPAVWHIVDDGLVKMSIQQQFYDVSLSILLQMKFDTIMGAAFITSMDASLSVGRHIFQNAIFDIRVARIKLDSCGTVSAHIPRQILIRAKIKGEECSWFRLKCWSPVIHCQACDA